jgi:twinkle protein
MSQTYNWAKYDIDISKVVGGKTFCPKCHHTRKHRHDRSLSVDVETGLFRCHNHPCDFKGFAGDKYVKREAREYIRPQKRIQHLSDDIVAWFEGVRGISNNTLLRMGITETLEWMPQVNDKLLCVCFNYIRDEQLINIKYRGPQKEFKMVSGAELIFYNLDAIKHERECIIVEGEIDVLTAVESGIFNAISVPNGASLSSNAKLEYLENCWEYFEVMDKIVIATDGDQAGHALRDELARRLGKHRCYKVEYPQGCKDSNEVLLNHGRDAVKKLFSEAKPFPVEGVVTLEDMYDDVQELYTNGYPPGLKAGIDGFDEHASFNQSNGELWIVTGSPGSGKSEFVDWIMAQMRIKHDWKWGVFSFETQPPAIHVTLLMQKIVGKSFQPRADANKMMLRHEAEYAAGMIDEHFFFVNIDETEFTIDAILEKCRMLVVQRGINGVVIDPWNYIEAALEPGQSETQYINQCLKKIKVFTRKYGVHIFLIAHPTKLKKENGKYEVPTMYQISGSAHFFNHADNGFAVWRDFETGVVEIHIQKIKRSWLGQLGRIEYLFDTQTRQYKKTHN